MSRKTVWIVIVCTWVNYFAHAQINRFKLPVGADYEAGVVLVKLKPSHKDIFQSGQPAGRLPGNVRSSNVKPLLTHGSRNKSAARMAPRKPHVDLSVYFKLKFDKSYPIEDYINDLYATGYFEIVEPVYVQTSFFMPNDPLIANQYYLNIIKANQAWDVTQGSPSMIIGIVDTGGDLNHPDLQGNIYIDPADPTDGIDNDNDGYIDNNRGWDFSGADVALIGSPNFKGDNNPSVFSGNRFAHGTMVAGCASATTNDAVGISGVGFNTKLLFTKHYADNQPSNSTSYTSDLYEGVLYAATHGAKIINCSWGNPNYSGIAQDIIKYVTLDLGCLVVAAAGNSNLESPLYPAAYDYVLSVASSDENDLRSWFSNYGKTVDITAPGSNIYTTNYDDGYRSDSGTSLSAPIVSGAAALVWEHNPAYTPLQILEQLRISADETFYDNNPTFINKLGKGRLDIARALTFQSPSIRANHQRLVNAAGDFPGPGQSGKLYFNFTNYLKPSSSALKITLTSASPYVSITQSEFRPGVIKSNDSVNNNTKPFELTFAPNLPIDLPVEALLTFTDGSYHDTQVLNFVIPSFIDVNENNILTSIASAGRIGYGNTQAQNSGSGFVYNDEQLLYEMGVIMGTSSSVIFDNVRGVGGVYNQDFTSSTKIKKITPGERSYSEVLGSFRNAANESAQTLLISYRSLVWKNDPYKNFVILEYKIKNTTSTPLSNFYMGIFADWDILSGGSSDRASWDNGTRLGYVYAAQPSSLPRAGIQSLTGNATYYAIDNDNAIAGNPFGLYDGFTDAEKHTSISSGLLKVNAGGTNGTDVSHVVGSGPYAIAGGQEITIAFALHGASTQANLINSAKYADSLYNYTFKAPKPVANSIEVCLGTDALLKASGATKFNWYKEFIGGSPVFSGSQFNIPGLKKDTLVYVSNADHHYESLRTRVTVGVTPPPEIVAPPDLEFCEGESIALSVDVGEEYTWSNGKKTQTIDVTTAGRYTVTVRNGSLPCTSLPVDVIVNPAPVAGFTATPEVISTEEEVIFSNESSGAISWEWDFGDGSESVEKSPSHQYDVIGGYTVTLKATSDKGCVDIESKSIGIITGTETSLAKTTLLYPNPIHDDVLFMRHSVSNEPIEIDIYDVQGALVSRQTIDPNNEKESSLNVSALASGVYQVQIRTRDEILKRKIVVVR
ncbi:MAG TPA: S8 family serine peptidase [Chryseolinea sp.]|nr:S8 family serine peptidase [Chryseolinea sp.]